jgi:hypothetical protein
MGNFNNSHNKNRFTNRIYHTVVAYADAVFVIRTFQFLATLRAGGFGEIVNRCLYFMGNICRKLK